MARAVDASASTSPSVDYRIVSMAYAACVGLCGLLYLGHLFGPLKEEGSETRMLEGAACACVNSVADAL